MGREYLIQARRETGLSQIEFAEKMKVRQATVSHWETGKADPDPVQIPLIRAILQSSDPKLFDIQGSAKGLKNIMEILRRQFLELLGSIGGVTMFGNVSLAMVSSPVVEPDEYLAQAHVTMSECWEWLNSGSFSKVERTLTVHMPTLKRLANTLSPFQDLAASLAVQGLIMQILLATRNLDFLARETYCVEAVHFGQLSGNRDILATALGWQGNTYILCYRQPQRAIAIFNEALSVLNSDTSQLTRSTTYSNLAIAHAEDKDTTKAKENEKLAREYAERARITMPQHPELEPFHQYNYFGHSELDQMEGIAYLHLSKNYPIRLYAQSAYTAFDRATSKQALDKGYLSGSLIKKADAASALGELPDFIDNLARGIRIAVEIGSKRRIGDAVDVMQRIPEKWQGEGVVQDLQKELSHARVGLV